MQTRVSMLQRHLKSETTAPAELMGGIGELEMILRKNTGTVVDRLVEAGEGMRTLLIRDEAFLRSNSFSMHQIKGFVRAFIAAAENSQNERIIKTATGLADTFTEIRPA